MQNQFEHLFDSTSYSEVQPSPVTHNTVKNNLCQHLLLHSTTRHNCTMCAEVQRWCRMFTAERGANTVYQWQQSVPCRLEAFIDIFCFGPCYLENMWIWVELLAEGAKPSFPEDPRSPKPNAKPICIKSCVLSHLFKWMTEACFRNGVVFVTPLYVTYTLGSFAAVPVHLLPIDWLPLWPASIRYNCPSLPRYFTCCLVISSPRGTRHIL